MAAADQSARQRQAGMRSGSGSQPQKGDYANRVDVGGSKASLRRLIILTDVAISLVEQLLICVELVFEQRAPQFLLHQAFTLSGLLPIWKPDFPNDVIDIGNDALDDNVGAFRNSRLVRNPCSWRSFTFSSRSPDRVEILRTCKTERNREFVARFPGVKSYF